MVKVRLRSGLIAGNINKALTSMSNKGTLATANNPVNTVTPNAITPTNTVSSHNTWNARSITKYSLLLSARFLVRFIKNPLIFSILKTYNTQIKVQMKWKVESGKWKVESGKWK